MKEHYRKAFSLTSIYAAASVAERTLGFLLLPVYTLYLAPSDFGLIALLTLTVNLSSRFITSPINGALTRFYYQPDFLGRRSELLANLLALLLAKGAVVVVIWWLMSAELCLLLFEDLKWLPLVQAFGVLLPLQAVSGLFMTLLRLKQRALYSSLVQLSNVVLTVGVTVYLLAVTRLGVIALVYGQIFSHAYRILLCAPSYLKGVTWSPDLGVLRQPLAYAYPLLVGGYSNLVIQAGDRYALAYFMTISDVGLYNFGYLFGSLVTLLLVDPTTKAFQPVLLRQEAQPDQQRVFVRRSASTFYGFGLLLVLALSLFSREIIMVMSSTPEFEAAWVVVPIIAFSALQHGLGGFLGAGIMLRRKSFHSSGLLLVSALVNVGLNIVLIPLLGILGAALATLASYAVWNSLRIYFSARFFELHFELRRMFLFTALAATLCGATLLAASQVGFWLGLVAKTLTIAAYPLLVVVTGLIRPNERELVARALRNAPRPRPGS